jgi:galactose mutarotase-like enzyme
VRSSLESRGGILVRAPGGTNKATGRRTFDDLYRLGRDRHLALMADDDSSIMVRSGAGYPYAQVWVPAGRPFAALKPMTAPTNALVAGTVPMIEPGDAFTAGFTFVVEEPR